MKTAKQQAIEAAFGDTWSLFTEEYKEHLLTRKHWVDMSVKYGALVGDKYYKSPTPQILGFEGEIEINCEFWRPISLKGIEHNNGWIRIETEDDFPKTTGNFKIICDDGFLNESFPFLKNEPHNYEQWLNGEITHYKPSTPELKPIY